jgi:hypothetical protein
MAFALVQLKNILLHLTLILDVIFYPTSRQYHFFLCLMGVTFLLPPWRFLLPHGNIIFGLAAAPHVGILFGLMAFSTSVCMTAIFLLLACHVWALLS